MVWGSAVTLAIATQVIQFIIAPTVMVSACSLILNGILVRYAQVNDRLRLMAHERWDLVREAARTTPDPAGIQEAVEGQCSAHHGPPVTDIEASARSGMVGSLEGGRRTA